MHLKDRLTAFGVFLLLALVAIAMMGFILFGTFTVMKLS